MQIFLWFLGPVSQKEDEVWWRQHLANRKKVFRRARWHVQDIPTPAVDNWGHRHREGPLSNDHMFFELQRLQWPHVLRTAKDGTKLANSELWRPSLPNPMAFQQPLRISAGRFPGSWAEDFLVVDRQPSNVPFHGPLVGTPTTRCQSTPHTGAAKSSPSPPITSDRSENTK